MREYTAEDFAKAKFAEHASGDAAFRIGKGDEGEWESSYRFYTDAEIAAEGWVPVPTKPVLTEGELYEACGLVEDDYADGFKEGFRIAGGSIIPDPEPTNAEKLRALWIEWNRTPFDDKTTFTDFLDAHGVKAGN